MTHHKFASVAFVGFLAVSVLFCGALIEAEGEEMDAEESLMSAHSLNADASGMACYNCGQVCVSLCQNRRIFRRCCYHFLRKRDPASASASSYITHPGSLPGSLGATGGNKEKTLQQVQPTQKQQELQFQQQFLEPSFREFLSLLTAFTCRPPLESPDAYPDNNNNNDVFP